MQEMKHKLFTRDLKLLHQLEDIYIIWVHLNGDEGNGIQTWVHIPQPRKEYSLVVSTKLHPKSYI